MREVEARNGVVLLPVLEIEPYRFSSLRLPEVVGSRQNPAPWGDYFRRCMADAGFTGVEPIAEGSSFVSARSLIGNALLDRLIRDAIEGTELVASEIPRLSGGLALITEAALITPSCCGDLSDFRSWTSVLAQPTASGQLWIGHPQLGFSIEAGVVTLTEQVDYGPPPPDLLRVRMPQAELKAAIVLARRELRLFRAELVPMVSQILGSARHANRVISALAGIV